MDCVYVAFQQSLLVQMGILYMEDPAMVGITSAAHNSKDKGTGGCGERHPAAQLDGTEAPYHNTL